MGLRGKTGWLGTVPPGWQQRCSLRGADLQPSIISEANLVVYCQDLITVSRLWCTGLGENTDVYMIYMSPLDNVTT